MTTIAKIVHAGGDGIIEVAVSDGTTVRIVNVLFNEGDTHSASLYVGQMLTLREGDTSTPPTSKESS